MAAQQGVDVTKLSAPELKQLLDQLEQEVQQMSENYQHLGRVHGSFSDARDCASEMKKAKDGDKTFIPLTESLYVPGELVETEKVMVDVGTGYYVEKSPKHAAKYFERKVDMIKENMEQARMVITKKQQDLEMVHAVYQSKVAESQAQGQ